MIGLGLVPLAILFVLDGVAPSGEGPVARAVGQVLFVAVYAGSFPMVALGALALAVSGVLALPSRARRGMRP